MKIKSSNTGNIYEVEFAKAGQQKVVCPECSRTRKNSKDKSLSFNMAEKKGLCHHCKASFFEYKPYLEKKQYKIPEWSNKTELSDKAVKWFSGRMISQDTLILLGISSAREYIPQYEKEVDSICFPYYRGESLVNIKFRGVGKSFKLVSGAELIFYNLNAVKDTVECVIVEGEIDCLSFIEAGVKNVISVPNGAGGKNLEYVDNCYDDLSHIETFYIAVDNDLPGISLKEELVRRFGAEKCKIVNFLDCKDANEYLVKYGGIELKDTITNAQPLPITDVVDIDGIYDDIYSMYQNGLQPGLHISDYGFDKLVSWEPGRLYTITGIPSHGKTVFLDYILTRLNCIHGWKVAMYSPENFPVKIHFAGIASQITGKPFNAKYLSADEFDRVYGHIVSNFHWIYPEVDITIENILSKARQLVQRNGIKVLVIDPYNKLEHTRNRNESETEYIGRFLDAITMFAKQTGCVVILVAHPTKMQKDKDEIRYKVPTLYDISGSSNFYNKTDFGIIVYRDFDEKTVSVIVQKVKFRHLGETGNTEYKYNLTNGRFYPVGDKEDNGSYLDRDWTKSSSEHYNPNIYIEPSSDFPF